MTFSLILIAALAAEPPSLVPLASDEGLARLSRSTARVDFAHLANEYETQENKAFCGVASAVIVLNALRDRNDHFEKPEDARLLPPGWVAKAFDPLFHRYTQGDFFTKDTDAVKTRSEVLGQPKAPGAPSDGGLQLRQLGKVLATYGLAVEAHVADDKLSATEIRRDLVQNLSTEGDYAVVNYTRSALGQTGGGHISPLGAYDAPSDSFLVLDVNANAHPWVWVPAGALIKAMETKDTVENRGYLLIKEGLGH